MTISLRDGSQFSKHLTCSVGLRTTVTILRLQAADAHIRGKARVPLQQLVSRDIAEKGDERAIVLETGTVILVTVAT